MALLRISALGCALLLASGLAQAQESVTGVWTGIAFEVRDGDIQPWGVNMKITGPNAITVDYAPQNCGGTLAYLRTVGEALEYRETLTYGTERCVSGGIVGFIPKAGQLLWYWSGEGTEHPDALDTGVLSRN